MCGAVFVQGCVDLAAAEDDAVDFVVWCDRVVCVRWVGDDPLEVGFAREVGQRRAGERVAEEGFGEEEDEGYGFFVKSVLVNEKCSVVETYVS